jgi:TPR repeat protein
LGYPRAFLRIGEMHERGLGTPVDPSQALACYRKARETGDLRPNRPSRDCATGWSKSAPGEVGSPLG